jgi:LytS/YehU family sensor histidine kinase
VKAVNAYGKWSEKAVSIEIVPAWWSRWWFRLSVLLAVVAIIYFLVKWRLHEKYRLQMERSEKEKELSRLQHRTAQLEMHALRAQMNPHFLFNSLNSINRFIIQNNSDQASGYLTKFSRLMRLILQNSQHELIPLESELEALKLYLELEAVRFDHHFTYSIHVDENLDMSMLKVPPLIIQPYAENAIWHGLMHKEEQGKLVIDLREDGDYLICSITDDGIGRKKAAELKSKSASTHKSMGMKITADRIASMKWRKANDNGIQITDLVLPDGTPAGTRVEIKIPIQYD